MATTTMKLIPAKKMLVEETKKEVEAGAPHLERTDQRAITLGGSPGSKTSLFGWEPASSDEETMI